ncbi:single-stranded-DNA-specific exonuclease RecJ [Salinisphaera sp. USBA-960]|nr:single-stranded-DNA-specific exonuclease RecJ [Salifodinibacter halophilus]NNC26371.1 single-stranded-DNA-specific exonuclease RecJ [Salifodinibacter halophilus]
MSAASSAPESKTGVSIGEQAAIERREVGTALPAIESALLARIYAARGATSDDILNYSLAALPHFRTLAGIDPAAAILETAITAGHRIVVVGDFDADGATSTALACHALRAFGAAYVDYHLPHRVRDGYGLSPGVVETVGMGASGDVIVTVDNGISSVVGVDAARAAGWQVIVLDHHLPGDELPRADAIVNPNQPDGGGATLGVLAGVGVTFYAMLALRARFVERLPANALPRMSDYLDLVAIGTVADCVPMQHVNRVLVAQGIRRIRAGRNRPGVAALIMTAGRQAETLTARDVGFSIGPRLNAAGRLDDMALGVACLLTDSPAEARQRADELGELNNRRRTMQDRMQTEADAAVADVAPAPDTDRPAAQVVYRADWHEGVVGLIAGRLARDWHRPAVAFAPADNGLVKGSARSIDGLNIRDALAAVDAAEPDLIARFGGHAGAAGLSMAVEHIDRFAAAFSAVIESRLTPALASPAWTTDGALAAAERTLATAKAVRDGGPWGIGFEEPQFDGVFDVQIARIVGERHVKLWLRTPGESEVVEAIWFNGDTSVQNAARLQTVYRVDVNHYNARERLQLVIQAAWAV